MQQQNAMKNLAKSHLLYNAHQLAKSWIAMGKGESTYRATFSEALKMRWEEWREENAPVVTPIVEVAEPASVKEIAKWLVSVIGNHYNTNGKLEALAWIGDITEGFAGQVASTVVKSRRISEKQAWVLANNFPKINTNQLIYA